MPSPAGSECPTISPPLPLSREETDAAVREFKHNRGLIVARANRTYKVVAAQTAKSNYRPDLRKFAVERVSAIRRSQRPVKATPEPKLRGNKAKKAAEAEA